MSQTVTLIALDALIVSAPIGGMTVPTVVTRGSVRALVWVAVRASTAIVLTLGGCRTTCWLALPSDVITLHRQPQVPGQSVAAVAG